MMKLKSFKRVQYVEFLSTKSYAMKNLTVTLALGIICSLLFTQEIFAQMGMDGPTIKRPEVLNVIGVISNAGDTRDHDSGMVEEGFHEGGFFAYDIDLEEEETEAPAPLSAVVFDEALMEQDEWLTPVLQNIAVYPMPANDFIFIELEKSADYEVNIINMVGQIVSSEKVMDTRKHQLDISHLPTGIYLLNFTSGIEMSTKRINVK